jgi:hypothetical protein
LAAAGAAGAAGAVASARGGSPLPMRGGSPLPELNSDSLLRLEAYVLVGDGVPPARLPRPGAVGPPRRGRGGAAARLAARSAQWGAQAGPAGLQLTENGSDAINNGMYPAFEARWRSPAERRADMSAEAAPATFEPVPAEGVDESYDERFEATRAIVASSSKNSSSPSKVVRPVAHRAIHSREMTPGFLIDNARPQTECRWPDGMPTQKQRAAVFTDRPPQPRRMRRPVSPEPPKLSPPLVVTTTLKVKASVPTRASAGASGAYSA